MLVLVIDNNPVCTLTTDEVFNNSWLPKFKSEYLNWEECTTQSKGFFQMGELKIHPRCKKLFTGVIRMHGKVYFSVAPDTTQVDEDVEFSIFNIE